MAPIVVDGPFVAFNVLTSYHPEVWAAVNVVDTRNRRRLHEWGQGGPDGAGWTELTQLRLNHFGAAAWIVKARYGLPAIEYHQVFLADRRSRDGRELESAPSVDSSYLKISHDRVYWRSSGTTKSAPIH